MVTKKVIGETGILLLVIVLFYYISTLNYVLFHTLPNFFSIIIAFSLFILSWNSREINENQYLLFLGIAFLFIGTLDFFHTLTYQSLNLFPLFTTDLSSQFWITARFMEAVTLLAASFMINKTIHITTTVFIYLLFTVLVLVSVFSGYFPVCFTEETGFTTFMKISEYLTAFIFAIALWQYHRKRRFFISSVRRMLYFAIMFAILTEISFIFHGSINGFFHFMSHIFKLISYYLIYKALISLTLKQPYHALYGKLKENEIKLRNIIENSTNVFFSHTTDHVLTYLSPQILDLLGYTQEEAKIKWTALVSDNPLNEAGLQNTEKAILSGEPQPPYELELVRKDGRNVFVEVRESPVLEQGRTVAIVGSLTDISKRKEAENLYFNLLENAPNLILTHKLDGTINYINGNGARLLGFPKEALIGKNLNDLLSDKRDEITDNMEHLLKNREKVLHTTMELKINNEKKYIEIYGIPISHSKNLDEIMVQAYDITEQKDAEKAMKESEKKFKALYDNAPLSYQSLDKEGRFIDINDTWLKTLGYSREEVLGKNYADFLHPDWKPHFEQNFPAFKKRGYVHDVQFKIRHKNGSYIDISFEGCIGYNPDGSFKQTYCVFQDITDRKKAENDLKESEARFKALHNASFGGITIHDKGKILECNKGLSDITGYSEEELIGMDGLLLIAEETRQKVLDNILAGYEKPYEAIGIRKNGEKYPLRLEAREIPYQGKQVRVAEFRDITEFKRTELELLKMEKLRSLGNLAGGIAHDFNNLLTGIYGNVSIALEKTDQTNPLYKYLAGTEKSIERATKLTNQLLTFSKGGDPVKTRIDIGKLVKETVLFDLSGSTIKPVFDLPEKESIAEADESQMEQVISNLVINAQQATPQGGPLYISLENYTVDPGEIVELPPGDYWKISIRDKGTGIPAKYMDKIFDPYFTTKERGHGLGLATIYSIIKRHNGHIEVQSEWGAGTTFTIYLPAVAGESADNEEKPEKKTSVKDKIFKVLIMDDEEMIRETLSEMISVLGHEADTVSDGEEAITRYKQALEEKKPYDLVIMDLTIPGGMGGGEAVKEILKNDKQARVIVSSGYSGSGDLTNYRKSGFMDMIEKPYTMTKLKEILSRVME